jgi:hypothetical protein
MLQRWRKRGNLAQQVVRDICRRLNWPVTVRLCTYPCNPPNSQTNKMIGIGIPINQSSNPRPMAFSIIAMSTTLMVAECSMSHGALEAVEFRDAGRCWPARPDLGVASVFSAGGDGVRKSPDCSAQRARAASILEKRTPDKHDRQIHQEDDPSDFEYEYDPNHHSGPYALR